MKKITLLFTAILGCYSMQAQFISDPGSNKPLYSSPGNNIQGNPFLNTNWSSGVIRTERGMEYSNLFLKFDVYNSELVFNVNDSMYRFTEPVKEFLLNTPNGKAMAAKFIKSSFVHNLLPAGFVQEVVKGKMCLYKYYKKDIVETTSYNMVAQKQFEDRVSYYVIIDNTLKPVSLNKKTLEEILKDKWVQVSTQMDQNGFSAKNEAGWVGAITYYNSL